jgi:hypothetical protein
MHASFAVSNQVQLLLQSRPHSWQNKFWVNLKKIIKYCYVLLNETLMLTFQLNRFDKIFSCNINVLSHAFPAYYFQK